MKLISLNEWCAHDLDEKLELWDANEYPATSRLKSDVVMRKVNRDIVDFVQNVEYEYFDKKRVIQFAPLSWNSDLSDPNGFGLYLKTKQFDLVRPAGTVLVLEPDYDSPGDSRIVCVGEENAAGSEFVEHPILCKLSEVKVVTQQLEILNKKAKKFSTAVKSGHLKLIPHMIDGTISCDKLIIEIIDDSYEDFKITMLQNIVNGKFEFPYAGNISGDFDCSYSGLSTLEGCPSTISGSFRCSSNRLTTLEHGPIKVGKNYDCSNNTLTSLDGAPPHIDGNFNCSRNNLKNLEGAPGEVVGDFDCSTNELATLEGGPKSVGLKYNCVSNKLQTLNGIASKLGNELNISYNPLNSLKDCPDSFSGILKCCSTKLTTLEGCPEILDELDCARTRLKSLVGGPKHVKGTYSVVYSEIETLAGCAETIEGDFYAGNSKLQSLEGGPKEVKGNYSVTFTEIETLVGCAETIGGNLRLENTKLKSLEGFPKRVNGDMVIHNTPVKFVRTDVPEGCILGGNFYN